MTTRIETFGTVRDMTNRIRSTATLGEKTTAEKGKYPLNHPFSQSGHDGTLSTPMRELGQDENLMLRYRDGDSRAFDLLFNRHRDALYRYLVRQCGIPAVADELFQDIWLNLIRARENYTVKAKFTTYLYSMARNRLIDYYRKHSAEQQAMRNNQNGKEPDDLQGDGSHEPENRVASRLQRERILEGMAELPTEQREAFLLHQEVGMTLKEIAELTGVSRETVKSRLRYATGRLRRSLRGVL
jgi:RNA polymerase sigma-70 factor (ECF subfamily)